MVFETQFEAHEGEADINQVRKQLSLLCLKVQGRNIYDNRIAFERDFRWFSRYGVEKPSAQ